MLGFIWLFMILLSIICGVLTNHLGAIVAAVTQYAKLAFEMALGLAGIMTLWLGIMKIAEEAGLMKLIARFLSPIMRRLFAEVPPEHPAMGAMILNIAANMLGLANAATPFGLRAMQELETLNPNPGVATNAMCMFLAINTSSVQLIPTTAIAFLAAAGSTDPSSIIVSTLIATCMSTLAAVAAAKFFEGLSFFKRHTVTSS